MLVNWENLGGFLEIPPMDVFREDIVNWVTGDKLHEMPDPSTGQMSEDYFRENLRVGMKDFWNKGPNVKSAIDNLITRKYYAYNPGLWMGQGSAMSGNSNLNKRAYYMGKDKRWKQVAKNKARTGIAVSPDIIHDILKEKDDEKLRQYNKVVPKPEAGKVRAVVNSDLELFWRMDYVSSFIETAMKGHPETTLYFDQKQLFDLWWSMGIEATDLDSIKLPLDQSHFDWQQNMRMIEDFCVVLTDWMKSVLPAGEARDDLLDVMDSISTAMYRVKGRVILPGGKKVGEDKFEDEEIIIEKGILSGWRWTALIDTVFNIAEVHCGRRVVSDASQHRS